MDQKTVRSMLKGAENKETGRIDRFCRAHIYKGGK